MATLAGEAAIRIVPSLLGFKKDADTQLKAMRFEPIKVKIDPGTKEATAQVDAWRKKQELNAVNIPIRGDTKFFERDIQRVEHIFKRNSLSKAISLNVKVIGLDALPALAYAAGSAASGLDALGKSAFALPGLFGGVAASIGALLIGLHGVSGAMKAYSTDTKSASQNAKEIAQDNRQLERSYRDYKGAVRDTIREIQDLNAENRRSSLNVADAVLSVQEAADRLRQGGQKSITELQRDQLGYLEAIDHLQDVKTRASRTATDTAEANTRSVSGSEKVIDALDKIAQNTDKINTANLTEVDKAMAKLAPNARATVEAIHGLSGEFRKLVGDPGQNALFAGMDKDITHLAQVTLPAFGVGITRVSTGLNTDLKAITASLGSGKNQSFLTRIFGTTEGGLKNFSKAIDPLVTSVFRLAASGNVFPRLGAAADKVFGRFDKFTEKISADGSLDKWIDQSLKALSSLGNAAVNIGSIVSSVSDAFNQASGHQGGFLKTLEDETKKLALFLQGGEGQFKLVEYFKQAREFIGHIKDAFVAMKPFVHDVVETARQWSEFIFPVVGALTQAALWLDRNTSAVKALVGVYLTLRTVKPIIEGLTGSFRVYNSVLQKAAATDAFGKTIPGLRGAADSMNALRGKALLYGDAADVAAGTAKKAATETTGLGKEAETAGQKLTVAQRAAANMEKNLFNFVSPAKDGAAALKDVGSSAGNAAPLIANAGGAAGTTAEKVKGLGTEAGTAAGKVGGGFVGALKNMAGALGPMALATGVVALTSVLITKLGEASRVAAAQHDKEADALERVATSLNDVTGAATGQTIAATAKTLQKYPIQAPGSPEVNVPDVLKNRGVNAPDYTKAASDPVRYKDLLNSIVGPQTDFLAKDVENSDIWKKNEAYFKDAHLSPHDIAVAITNDQSDEYKRLTALVDSPPSNKKNPRIRQKIPNTYDIRGALSSSQALQTVYPLVDLANKNRDTSVAIQSATATATGDRKFNTVGQNDFGRFAIDSGRPPVIDPSTGLGRVTLNNDPGKPQLDAWQSAGYQVPDGPNPATGQWEIILSPEATAAEFTKFATGGLVKGVGGPRDDLNMVRVSPNEHIAQAAAVDYYGAPLFDALNNMRIPRRSIGGWGGGFPQKPPVPTPPPAPPAGPVVPNLGDPGLGTVPGPSAPAPGIGVPGFFGGPAPAPAFTPPVAAPKAPAASVGAGPWGLPGAAPGGPAAGSAWGNAPAAGAPTYNASDGAIADGLIADKDNLEGYKRIATGAAPGAMSPGVKAALQDKLGLSGGVPAAPLDSPVVAPTDYSTNTQTPGAPNAPSTPSPTTPIYSLTPGANGGVGVAPNGPVISQMNSLIDQMVGTPYISGGNTIAGTDCSGLASYMANIATGRDPFSGRFGTSGEAAALQERGFLPGKGPPGTLTIGWNAGHTAITLPDGSSVSSGENGGVKRGGGGANEAAFTDFAYLPVSSTDVNALNALLPGGVPGGVDTNVPGVPQSWLQSLLGRAGIQLPGGAAGGQGLDQFLTSEAGSVGGSLLNIGTSFLSGITGIDFGSILGPAQQITNGAIGVLGKNGRATGANGDVSQLLKDYQSGSAGISPQAQQMLANLGIAPSGGGGGGGDGKGAELYRPLVRQLLASVGPSVGIDPKAEKLWEDALVKQMHSESGGDPNSVNDHDPNGRGGTQTVKGLFNFVPSTFESYKVAGAGTGQIGDPTSQIAAAINYTAKKWGIDPSTGGPNRIGQGIGFASGGFPSSAMAMVSPGEYHTGAAATQYYGSGLYDALNQKKLPRGFADGGFPLKLPTLGAGASAVSAPSIGGGQTAGPLPLPAPADPAEVAAGVAGAAAGIGQSIGASTGGAPGPGATAPAPDPGVLPSVGDALANIGAGGTAVSGIGNAQPGAQGAKNDPRATLGAAPTSQEHNLPSLSAGIKGAASTIGSLAATAASLAVDGVAPGAGGAAGAGIQAGAQMAGDIASGAVNILSSFLVGTATNGSTANASGVPLLPARQPLQSGVPGQAGHVQNDNRTYNLTNLDDYKRQQEISLAQDTNPFIGKY